MPGELTWEVLTGEIDNGRPMVFGVWTGSSMHAVTVVGYRDTPTRQCGCLDTWAPASVIRWCDFEEAHGQSWGIYHGTSFSLAPIRQMHVKQDGRHIADETGVYDFRRVELGLSKTVSFTIENIGDTDINLTGSPIVDISGDDANAFTVTRQPLALVPAGGTVVFEITFSPLLRGHVGATVSIDNDESDKGAYEFSVIGTGGLAPMTIYVDDNGPSDPGSGTKEDPYRRIQIAVDAAYHGDEIIVADGIYTGTGNRDIDFGGKGITIRSRDPNNTNIVAATIIDCNGTEAEPHRGFYLHSGEDTNSVIAGLTITNGYGGSGAGISCEQASPLIIHCNLINGMARSWGGGICCDRSSAIIRNCTFTGNSAFEGGAITVISDGYPVIDNCLITDNTASGSGGGINVDLKATPTISNCTVSDNFAGMYGGGGISIFGSNPTIINCAITGNTTDSSGGGILHWYEFLNGSIISNCTITGSCLLWWWSAWLPPLRYDSDELYTLG